jgi:hypothetical protein
VKLQPIVLKLRLAETRFANRVAGAAEFEAAQRATLKEEAAFVLQLAETASPNRYDSGVDQVITEVVAVVAALRNDLGSRDKTGLTAYDALYAVRTEMFRALLGWQPPGAESLMYYRGGRLLDLTPAWLWYQFEFEVRTRITDADGVRPTSVDDFLRLFAQWELTPSENIPMRAMDGLPVTAWAPDLEELIDFTADPNAGDFNARAFGRGFERYGFNPRP